MEVEQTRSEIEKLATRVGAEYEDQCTAIAAEREAESGVLEGAIAACRPALKALASGIFKRYFETSGRNGCNPVERKETFEERGLLLVDNYERKKDETGNRGSYDGDRLYLLVTGDLAVVTRTGDWSCWQGEGSSYDATLKVITTREAMDTYLLDACLEAILKALNGQAGKRPVRTVASSDRATRLNAMLALVK